MACDDDDSMMVCDVDWGGNAWNEADWGEWNLRHFTVLECSLHHR